MFVKNCHSRKTDFFPIDLPKTAKMAKLAKTAIFEAGYLKNEVPDQKSETKRFSQMIKKTIPDIWFLPISAPKKSLSVFSTPQIQDLAILPRNGPVTTVR